METLKLVLTILFISSSSVIVIGLWILAIYEKDLKSYLLSIIGWTCALMWSIMSL